MLFVLLSFAVVRLKRYAPRGYPGIIYFAATPANYTVFEYQPVLLDGKQTFGVDSIFMRPDKGNTIPAFVAILVPVLLLLINLVGFEFMLMRMENGNYLAACMWVERLSYMYSS